MKSFSQSSFQKIPPARPEVEKIEPYSAPLEGRRRLLRLDFNENTIGPSPKVLNAIRNISGEQISIYPEYNGLQAAVANNINTSGLTTPLNSKQVGVFNGVDGAINAIFHSYGDRNKTLLTTIPTFGYYLPCASMQGMQTIQIPYEGSRFKFPYDKISESLKKLKPKILILCNPNNPTGTNLSAYKILELAAISPETLVVVDELYEAFLGDSLLPIINFDKTPNLVVLRSLSKTAGLAGLRIGFALGHSEVIDRIRRVTGPYDINSFAVTAAFAALEDKEYIEKYVAEVLKAREWICTQLFKKNIRHHVDAGNYFLLWPNHTAKKIEDLLKSAGILVRNMEGKPLIDGSLRISIGTTTQMQQFWNAYQKVDNV